MIISARHLTMTYGSGGTAVHALAGVGLDLDTESVAVMGPSGSGKSSLLHCLAGIVRPTTGSVVLDGVDLTQLPDRRRTALRRTAFGFVFQSGQLLAELPADENVALPLMLGGTPVRDAVARARELLSWLGLAGMEGRRPGELSGGQAQRVAVARALVVGPRVVFADEPTGALDQQTGREVMDVLVNAVGRAGAGLVVVTHDAEVARTCRRTLAMADGRVVAAHRADGRPDPTPVSTPFGQPFSQPTSVPHQAAPGVAR